MFKLIYDRSRKGNYQSGQAMLLTVLFFLAISMSIVFGIATPILKQVRISKDILNSKESFFLANGAIEDIVYRLKSGKQVAASETESGKIGRAHV